MEAWARQRRLIAGLAVGGTLWLAAGAPGLAARTAPARLAQATATPVLSEAYRLTATWDGTQGQGAPGSVLFPAGIDMTDNDVFLVDRGNHRVQQFTVAGQLVRAWGQLGDRPGDLRDPRDISIDGGRLFVTDTGNGRLVLHGLDGTWQETWQVPEMTRPWGVAAWSGRAYVTDVASRAVLVLERGTLVARWTGMTEPLGLSVGPDGRVYVADRGGSAVRIFGPDGSPAGDLATSLPPIDVAVDPLGDIYVQSTGAVLWYPSGSSVSRYALYAPGMQGVALSSRRGVYTTVARMDVRAFPSFHGVLVFRWQPTDGKPTEWPLRGFPPGRLHRPHALHVGPRGTVWVLDAWPRLQGFDDAGRSIRQAVPETTTGIVPVDLAESPSGELLVGETRRLLRVSAGGSILQEVRLGSGTTSYWLTALDWRAEGLPRVSVLDSAWREVRDYGVTRTLQPIGSWPLDPGGGWSLFWDLDEPSPNPGNRLYAVNRDDRAVWVFEGGRRVARWAIDGIPTRLAVGPAGHVFVLTVEGLVYKLAADGTLRAAWDAGAFSAGASDIADLAVDARGRVYTADRAADTVRIWEPDPGATPEYPTSRGGSCRLRADKRAAPAAVRVGDRVHVALQVGGDCPVAAPRADILLAIDRSGSMNGGTKITDTRAAALVFLGAIDLTRDRVGIVAFNNAAQLRQPLTTDRAAAENAVRQLTAVGGTNLADAIRLATAELFGPNSRPQTQPVLILLTDGRDPDPDAALDAAAAARERGTRVFTIGFGEVDPMVMVLAATSPENHYYTPDTTTLTDIYTEIAKRITARVLATAMTVTDELPADMRYVAGSAQPPATWDSARRTLTWQLTDIPFAGVTLGYDVEPTLLGRRATNVVAVADYVDGLNRAGRVRFPVPEVTVLAVEPTVTPTFTPFPTPTPRPTATPPPPEPLYLPIAVRQRCRAEAVHADIALVMDTSSSMQATVSEGGPMKLAVAVAAARILLDLLQLPGDQAAIVSFDSEARIVQTLTGDRDALYRTLAGLAPGQGTRIDLGIQAAHDELTSERGQADNNRVMVLLTDGVNTGAPDSAVRDRAAEARLAGVLIYTIGLGTDVDAALLREIATAPEMARLAPSPDDLASIYRAIAYTIACPNLTWP